MIGVFSLRLRNIPALDALVGQRIALVHLLSLSSITQIAGWGLRPSAVVARRFAAHTRIPFVHLEDGFLRSVGRGDMDPPLSIVVDDCGVHYDATRPSRLERLIPQPLDAGQHARASALIRAWKENQLSKYNHQRDRSLVLPERFVLVVDQTRGDASIEYGQATPATFRRMLDCALAENPQCQVVLKVHPDVVGGRKRGHFDYNAVAKNPRVRLIADEVNPAQLIKAAEAVYVVTSQLGFEGLIWRKRVRTFGMPFYAGWGLTEDELPAPERRKPVSLEQLVHAALVEYPRYLDPETKKRCEVETVIAHLGLQRRMRERFPEVVYAHGFSGWKKPLVRRFLWGSEVRFVRDVSSVPPGAMLAVWGNKPVTGTLPEDVSILRLEDGFLRSVGLGADLVRPLSWAIDREGIYYDANRPSELERILQTADFTPELIGRAARLRSRIVEAALTKYNVGAKEWKRPAGLARVILVPGQVEDDASIRYGTRRIRSNMALLQAVRQANPDAYVIYKPHPDVVAGLRAGGTGEENARSICDEVVIDVAMGALLQQVDEVHVLTSLTGFEALLRGKKVVTYGLPFYAGWGLTSDHERLERRTRRLTLDELVAGTLILYPTYVSRVTGRFTTPERALDELLEWRDSGEAHRLPLWRRLYRKLISIKTRSRNVWIGEAGRPTAGSGYCSSKVRSDHSLDTSPSN